MNQEKVQAILTLLREQPYTPSELASILRMHHYTVEKTLMQLSTSNPEVRCKSMGRYKVYWVRRESPEEYSEFIREIFPRTTPEIQMLLRLLEDEALTPEKAISIKNFADEELKTLDSLASKQRVVVTTSGKVYLTELGRDVAKGAQKTYRRVMATT